MNAIIAEMVKNLGGFSFENRHDPAKRKQLRRCLQFALNHKRVRGYEVPGRDNSRDLRLQA